MAQDAEWLQKMQSNYANLSQGREDHAQHTIVLAPGSSCDEVSCLRQWRAHQQQVSCLAPHPFVTNKVLSGSYDKRILTWSYTEKSHVPEGEIHRHGNVVSQILVLSGTNPDFFLLSSSWDGASRLVGLPKKPNSSERFLKGEESRTMPPGKPIAHADIQTSQDHRQVFILPMLKPHLWLFNTLGDLKFTYTAPGDEAIAAFAVGKTQCFIALWESYTIHALTMATMTQATVTDRNTSPKSTAVSMVAHPNEEFLAVCTTDGVITIYNPTNLTVRKGFSLQTQTKKIALSPKNPNLLAAVGQQGLAVINLETDKSYWTKGKKNFTSVCWACDGQTIYCGTTDGSIVVCPLPDAERAL